MSFAKSPRPRGRNQGVREQSGFQGITTRPPIHPRHSTSSEHRGSEFSTARSARHGLRDIQPASDIAQMQMPFPRHAQIGFPVRATATQQASDHVQTKELQQIACDPATEVQGRGVFQATELARLTHRATRHQNADSGTVARRMACEVGGPVDIPRGFLRGVGFMTLIVVAGRIDIA